MPRLSVWAIRLALCHLLLGFTIGALLLAHKGIPFAPWLWRLLPAHMEFLLFGWTVQLAMGVAYWILPRFPGGERRREGWARLAILTLNGGLWLVALGPLAPATLPLMVLGRGLEMGATVAFALHSWPRVKPMMAHE
ncbi:MAG: hypothetical protein R3C14_40975 [Caldilineaceae bacterium]